jgi:hypothetical protein
LKKSQLPTLENNQTLLLPMPPKKQPFELVPIPKKNHLFQSFNKKPPLERSGIIASSSPHPKKTLLKK